jgi:Flp pilus assembly protein TadB
MSTPVEIPQVEISESHAEQAQDVSVKAQPRRQSVTDVPKLGRATQGGSVSWVTSIFMVIFHILAITALFFFTWKGAIALVVLYFLSINVGIGMCYHRLLTHRGYKVPRWLEHSLAVCATLSLEGGPIFWVAHTASTTSTRTTKVTRIRRTRVHSGRIWAGL